VVRMDVLKSDSISVVENNVEIFPDVRGERIPTVVPGQVSHSVIGFSSQDMATWLASDEGKRYKTYIEKNLHGSKINTWLPAPIRQCRLCPNGKYVIAVPRLLAGQFNENELGFLKTRIQELSKGLNYLYDDQLNWFKRDISWMKLESLDDFEIFEICAQCPAGTYFDGTELDYAKTISPPPSMTAAITRVQKVMLGKWTLLQLRCMPCEEGFMRADTPDATRCTACGEYEFAEYTEEAVKVRSGPNVAYTLQSTMLPTKCSGCPAGTERTFDTPLCSSEKIAGNVPRENECCSPCDVNYFNAGTGGPCVPVQDLGATRIPYGNTAAVKCASGEQMKDCRATKTTKAPNFDLRTDLCMSTVREASNERDWRTCVECTGVERPSEANGAPTCRMCNGYSFYTDDPDAVVVEGEYYNASAAKCQACDACSVFTPAITWKSMVWDAEYTNAMAAWAKFGFEISSRWHTRHFDVARPCTPLGRRVLQWSAAGISVTGQDETKVPSQSPWKGQLFQGGPVPADSAINYEYLSRGSVSCTLQHCRTVCGAFYFYSQGCGARQWPSVELWAQTEDAETRTAKKLAELEAELKLAAAEPAAAAAAGAGAGPSGAPASGAPGALRKWRLKHHGHCVECTVCGAGEFNAGCNVWGAAHPRGSCASCLASCDAGHFLWHASGLRGCAPLPLPLQGRVTSNYVCRRCPTWVQNTSGIYAVLGCGNKQQFAHHTYGAGAPEDKTFSQAEVETGFAADEAPAVATLFKPFFRLAPYCPDRYFFDEALGAECRFTQHREFKLHREGLEFGYEEYRLACCRLCTDCDASMYRVSSQWLQCRGASREDTQGGRCVSSCQSEFWAGPAPASAAAPKGVCNACSEC
jgi:hypothetical protein